MPSVTSSCKGWFNPTLFWKNMTRFWPIWAFYGAIQFFLLPIELFNMTPGADRLTSLVPNVFHTATWMGVPLTLVFGCLIAMALFSYLMNPRAVSMYHTLPIRREGLFITNYVSAFCFYLLPSVVVGLLALLAEVRLGVFCAGGVLRWLMVQMFVGMFFFSFAVCCAMFTGHILALPVFYGVLNALVLGVSTMTDISMTSLLIGYSTRSALSSSVAVRWLTPAYHLGQMLSGGGKDGVLSFDNYVGAICYSLVGFTLFTCIALLTYQHRQLERAGDVVSVGWARPLFQWGVRRLRRTGRGRGTLSELLPPLFRAMALCGSGHRLRSGGGLHRPGAAEKVPAGAGGGVEGYSGPRSGHAGADGRRPRRPVRLSEVGPQSRECDGGAGLRHKLRPL